MFSGLAATTALTAMGLPVQAAPLPSSDQTLASHALKIFSNPQSARRLGASCCAHEGYISQNILVQSVFGAERHRLATASHAEVRDWLHARIRQDFADGRTVTVGGWVLSETETKVYMLAFMA